MAEAELSQDDGLRQLQELRERYGWAMLVMTRDDAALIAGRELTDWEWDRVRQSEPWTSMDETLCEAGEPWALVEQALLDVGIRPVVSGLRRR